MIRAYLSRSQTAWYASKKLHRIALESSDRERRAEGVESIIDQMYASRYMASRCGEIHTGTISSLTEWGIFALLSCGIEVAVSLPHKKYHLDPLQGTLSFGQKVLYTIGDTLSLEIDHIDAREYRIWATIPSIKRTIQKRNTRSKIHR